MRKCKRRASDVGYQQQLENRQINETLSPQIVNVERHSICESPLHLQETHASDRKSSSICSSSILNGIFSNKVN